MYGKKGKKTGKFNVVFYVKLLVFKAFLVTISDSWRQGSQNLKKISGNYSFKTLQKILKISYEVWTPNRKCYLSKVNNFFIQILYGNSRSNMARVNINWFKRIMRDIFSGNLTNFEGFSLNHSRVHSKNKSSEIFHTVLEVINPNIQWKIFHTYAWYFPY